MARVVEWSPDYCPAGHPLGPRQVLVGWHPCGCPGGLAQAERGGPAGHRTFACQTCHAVTYRPPCTAERDGTAGGLGLAPPG